MTDVKRASRDETYTLAAGKTREARDRSEEMTVFLERAGDRPVRFDVVFRAFDDGAAFRYVLPKQDALHRVEVLSEETRFRFLADHKAWVLQLPSFDTSNEGEFVPMPLLGIPAGAIVGPPLTIEAGDGLVAALAEANLRRWSGLHFARADVDDSRHPTLVTRLAPLPSNPAVVVRGALPLVSPWRVLMLGRGRATSSSPPSSPASPTRTRSATHPGSSRARWPGTGGTGRWCRTCRGRPG
jgi:alpha-glucosidase